MSPNRIPTALFRHPAWGDWKETQGWTRVEAGSGIGADAPELILSRRLGPGGSMAYVPGAFPSGADRIPDDFGAVLEEHTLRLRSRLPADCVFLRWDIAAPPWTDLDGNPLPDRLQELRMNAATAERRLRKSAGESVCLDTMVVDLRGGAASVGALLDARTRYSVRLAARKGTVVRRGGAEDLGIFHSLYERTAARQDLKPYPESCFRALFAAAGRHAQDRARVRPLELDLYVAESGGRAAASAVIARIGTDAWYLFAASDAELRTAAGPSAILHRALSDSAAAGAVRMDLLGVAPPDLASHPLSKLTRFKRGFGGKRRRRAGAWDFVLDPVAYRGYSHAEGLTSNGLRLG